MVKHLGRLLSKVYFMTGDYKKLADKCIEKHLKLSGIIVRIEISDWVQTAVFSIVHHLFAGWEEGGHDVASQIC